ncbi:MAG: hypothetical protein SCALA702_23850 [Melioribacteraceae bacterium]|nr:MAG: hypothetical protein SCALA702_23850 [Melioribacteraceae bacterium]
MRKVLLLFVLFSAYSVTSAQMVGGSFMLGMPKGEFKENVDRLGYGINLQLAAWEPSLMKPVSFGLNVGYMIYGEESFKRPLSLTNPDVTVDVDRKNSLLNFHLMLLVSPFPGKVKPYAELLGGGQYIFTSTDVESENNIQDVFSSTNFDDFGWSYGAGLGILFNVFGGVGGVGKIAIDLKARYMFSSEVEYLREGDIEISGGNVYFTPSKSTTDLVTIHLGVMVGLL